MGQVTASELEGLGIRTIGQLARLPPAALEARFGSGGPALAELARGRDDRPVEPFGAPKSMGAEETFGADHRDLDRLRATLRAQAERVARELRVEGYAGRVVTLKIRFADFSTYHARPLPASPPRTACASSRRPAALLERVRLMQAVRLIGLSVSGLGPAGQGQLPLFGPDAARRERLGRALDRLAERFGEDAVRPASLLGRRRSRPAAGGADGSPPAAARADSGAGRLPSLGASATLTEPRFISPAGSLHGTSHRLRQAGPRGALRPHAGP